MTVTETSGGTAQSDKGDLLTVSGLVRHFPIRKGVMQRQVAAVQAVDGIDFTVRQGETLSLVGESGCGKSTTSRPPARSSSRAATSRTSATGRCVRSVGTSR